MKKEINRINRNQVIAISYYKYAPETFKAYIKTIDPRYPNNSKSEEIFIEHNARSLLCMKFIAGNNKEGLDELKRIVRRQYKKSNLHFTIAFRILGSETGYAYIRQLVYPISFKNPKMLKFIFRELKEYFNKSNWLMEECNTAEIIPTPTGIKMQNENISYSKIDKSAPIFISGYVK